MSREHPRYTLEDLRRHSDAVGTWTTPAVDADHVQLEDESGPVALSPEGGLVRHMIGPMFIFLRDAEELGLSEDDIARDYPGIRLLPNPPKEPHHD